MGTNSINGSIIHPAFMRWLFWSAIIAVLIGGAIFRIKGLNETSSHGDALIHDVCKKGASPIDIIVKWDKLLGPTAQMAVPAAVTKLFLDVFHLPPTKGNVILPSALWGMLAVLAALWVGWRIGGSWFGVLLMTVVAFNPMHVQMSRMAYFYPPCVVGGFLMMWCLVESWERMKAGQSLTWRFHAVHVCAIGLLLYSTASAWMITALMGGAHMALSLVKLRRGQVSLNEAIILAVSYGVIGAPLLFISWGLPEIMKSTGQTESTAYWRKIFEVMRATPMHVVVSTEFAKFGWGFTPFRAALTAIVFAAGSITMCVRMRRDSRWGVPLVWFIIGLVTAVIAIQASTFPFGLRRVAAIWPFGFVILAAGLAAGWMIALPKPWQTVSRAVWSLFVVVLLGLWLRVDAMVLKVNGFMIPYQRIGQWLDSHFPKGTPVVTDRFYTAMCEFNNSDPTTNVVVISTVPNEIPEIQEKTRFRQVTRQYLEENPDAVFYCQGHMYERPEVVPWQWPAEYFRRRQEMRDDVQQDLSLLGQTYWNSYPPSLRWPVIYYNTIEDVIDINRKAGKDAFLTYGPEWRPVQTQDYQLWRLMTSDSATVKVYRIKPELSDLLVDITGVSVGGPSRLKIGQSNLEFPQDRVVRQQLRLSLDSDETSVDIKRGGKSGHILIQKIVLSRAVGPVLK